MISQRVSLRRGANCHAFKGGTKGSRIDFIFQTDDLVATAGAIDRTAKDGRSLSDHYPVTAVVRRK